MSSHPADEKYQNVPSQQLSDLRFVNERERPLLAQYFGRAMASFATHSVQVSRTEASAVGQKVVHGAQKYGFKQVRACGMPRVHGTA